MEGKKRRRSTTDVTSAARLKREFQISKQKLQHTQLRHWLATARYHGRQETKEINNWRDFGSKTKRRISNFKTEFPRYGVSSTALLWRCWWLSVLWIVAESTQCNTGTLEAGWRAVLGNWGKTFAGSGASTSPLKTYFFTFITTSKDLKLLLRSTYLRCSLPHRIKKLRNFILRLCCRYPTLLQHAGLPKKHKRNLPLLQITLRGWRTLKWLLSHRLLCLSTLNRRTLLLDLLVPQGKV